jgi:hypothetical protein
MKIKTLVKNNEQYTEADVSSNNSNQKGKNKKGNAK